MRPSQKETASLFSAVAATTTILILLLFTIFSGGSNIAALLGAAIAVDIVALVASLYSAAQTRRGNATVEPTAAALRQKEADLRETEERFSAVADNARAAFGILVGTRLVYANRYFSELTGYSLEEILSMDFRQMTHPAFQQLMVDRAEQRLAGEPVPSHYEFLAITKSGEEKWIDFSPAVAEWHGKRVVIGTGYDVTDRKRAEAALKESEEKFRLLAEHSKVFIAILRDRRLLHANPFLAEISGYTQEELLALDISELIPSEDRTAVLDRVRRRQAGETLAPSYEYRLVDKSGAVHWTQLWGVTIDYQGKPAVLAAGIDITARKRAEEALRQSEEQFRTLAESLPQLVWIAGPDGKVEYVNQRWCEQTGMCASAAIGGPWTGMIHPDDAEQTRAKWLHSERTGEPYEVEYRLRGREDTYRWFLARGLAIRDHEGKISRWFGTCTDIHERKTAQEELEKVARELTQANTVAEKAKAAAEDANRAKDRFLAMLSHELRSPLTPVLAAVSMLQQDAKTVRSASHTLEMIRRNVELEARLIDDLLDLTRITRGKVELNKQSIELSTIISRAIEVCQPDIDARHLHFGVDFGSEPYMVEADAARLQQVFWNLLRNSVKFTPHDGCIGISCRRVDGEVAVNVYDSGSGIEAEALPRIFDAFTQVRRGVTQQFGGLGLGLTICKSLVELHGGTIEAHSEGLGKGATFTVRLPLIVATPQQGLPTIAGVSEVRPSRAATRSLRVLVVEDHGDTAEMMQAMLESRGHRVITAGDVATALDTAAQHPFDLLISDLGLPDGSGLDLMRELRARGERAPAIALSGYGQESDIHQSREAGFNAHITKPIDLDRLISEVLKIGANPAKA